VIVDMQLGPGGHRFADADDVASIHERGVVLKVDAQAAERLPAPTANPATIDADPQDAERPGLEDKLRRAWDYLSGNY
jgi:hypothetical protein